MKEFSLEGRPHVDLCDLLKLTKLCESGGEAKHIIAEGKVQVDGSIELRKRAKILKGQVVEYKGVKVKVV